MRVAIDFLQSIVLEPHVRAAALVGTERRVLQVRFDDTIVPLRTLAQTIRPVFRSATPSMSFVRLEYLQSSLVFSLIGDHVLIVLGEHALDVAALLHSLGEQVEALRAAHSEALSTSELPQSFPDAEATPITEAASAQAASAQQSPLSRGESHAPEESKENPNAAFLGLINQASRNYSDLLGGAVRRNYLKKALTSAGDEATEHWDLQFNLDGYVSGELQGDPVLLAPRVRAWLEGFLGRVYARCPDAEHFDVQRTDPALSARLERVAFFQPERRSA